MSGFQHKQKKRPFHLSLYIPVEYQEAVKKAQKILRREEDSLSHRVCLMCEDYVRLHSHGNPQKLLFQETIKAPVKKCERCQDPADFQVFTKDEELLLCSLDFDEMQVKTPWRVKGWKKL